MYMYMYMYVLKLIVDLWDKDFQYVLNKNNVYLSPIFKENRRLPKVMKSWLIVIIPNNTERHKN